MRSLILFPGVIPLACLPSVGSGGERGTLAEIRDYALREAQAPELAQFEGGAHGFFLFLVAVALVVFLILELDHHHPRH